MSTTLLLDPPDLKNLSTPLKGFALDSVLSKKLTKLRPILEKYQYQDCYQMKYVREHSHMTSDIFGIFLTYLPSLIRYFTTKAYLVKSDAACECSLTIHIPHLQ